MNRSLIHQKRKLRINKEKRRGQNQDKKKKKHKFKIETKVRHLLSLVHTSQPFSKKIIGKIGSQEQEYRRFIGFKIRNIGVL